MARLLLAVVLLGWGQAALAYTWSALSGTGITRTGDSPMAACSAVAAAISIPQRTTSCKSVTRENDRTFIACYLDTINVGDNAGRTDDAGCGYVSRSGSGCQNPDAVYNSETGECVVPEPEDNECKGKIGQSVSWDSAEVIFEDCVGKCSVGLTGSSFSDSNSRQAYKAEVSEQVLFRNVGLYTGESCDGASTNEQAADVAPTEFQSDEECSETVIDGEGRQLSSCTSTDIYKDQRACVQAGGKIGSSNTGSGDMLTCVQSKGPKATKSTTETKVTTEKLPDGRTKTTTEVTTTTKNCVGTKACTSTSTTNTSVSHTNADGTKGSESSTCKGDKCGSDGKTDQGSDDGKDDEEKEEEGVDGPTTTLGQGEQGDFTEAISEWDQKITEARDDLTQKIDQLSGQFSGVFDLNLGGGGGSLPCEVVPISFGKFGSTNINLCLAAYDQYLGFLRYILLLAAAVMAAFIVMRN